MADLVGPVLHLSYTGWIIVLGALGQTAFVAAWISLPGWWREWIGRALMVKSGALAILFNLALVNYIWPGTVPEWLAKASQLLIVLGVWSQLAALVHERWKARRDRRHITGTHHDD